MNITRIVEAFGGVTELAKEVSVTDGAIYNWLRRDELPKSRRTDILIAAARRQVLLHAEDVKALLWEPHGGGGAPFLQERFGRPEAPPDQAKSGHLHMRVTQSTRDELEYLQKCSPYAEKTEIVSELIRQEYLRWKEFNSLPEENG